MKTRERVMKGISRRTIAMTVALAAILVSASAVAQTGGAPPSTADLGQGLYLGKALVVENVTAWPVYSTRDAGKVSSDFVTLADAQEKKQAVVREKGAGGGDVDQATVNELVIENRGKRPILVLAGTLLKGGKQDRQVGQDFIVPPGKTVPVEAFCVEHGRWTASRNGEDTGGTFRAKKALAAKAVRSSAQFKKDQGQVWDRVAGENRKAGKAPQSGTFMATVEETDRRAMAYREKISAALFGYFDNASRAAKAPMGFAYAVDGKVREVRTFTHPLIFQRFFETLFGTVAMEADLGRREAEARKRPVYRRAAGEKQVVDLVRGARRIGMKRARSKAGSVIKERKSEQIWNADCYESEEAEAPATRSFMPAE